MKKKMRLTYMTVQRMAIVESLFVLSLFVAGVVFLGHQTKPVMEIPKNEMHVIPPALQKKLALQPKLASFSATIRVPILLYHYIEYVQDKKDKFRQSLNINPN